MNDKPTSESLEKQVTELKRMKSVEEDALSAFFDQSLVMLFIADMRTNTLVRVNDEVVRVTGRTRKDLISLSFMDFIHPDDQDSTMKAMAQLADGNPLVGYQNRHLTADGQIRIFEWNAVPDLKRKLIYAMAQDITKQKQSDEALRTSEEKYRFLADNTYDVIWKMDLDLVFTYVNASIERLMGYTQEEWIGSQLQDYCDKQEFDRLSKMVEMGIAERDKNGFSFETVLNNRFGEQINIEITGQFLLNGSQQPIGLQGVTRDISERKKAEQEKEKLQEQLQQAQKMETIGNLAGGIAHDFNNILASIIGFTELALDETPEGTTAEDSLQEVYSAGKRAKDLVQQILAFARQSGEKRTPLQPVKIAKEVLKFIRSTIPATIQVQHSLDSESWIMGNATQIHQVLMNLCTNAAYAMEDSGGVLTVSMLDLSFDKEGSPIGIEAGDYVEIKVSDTGSGIAPEIIDSIFDPYFTTKGTGEGTGMGLAMVQGVIESYHGKILVDSQLGKGTTFTTYLPLTRKRTGHKAYMAEQLLTGSEHILFVDDEHPIAKMGSQILERLGYSVTTRTSSIEALELFKTKPNDFDLVVTDMTMPNMTGDQLAIEFMKIRNDIPVILCTGYSKKISEGTASEIGIKAFAYKPIVKVDLAKTVRKVLDETPENAE